MLYLVVFAGAGIGGALRHAVNLWAFRQFSLNFPLGTLIVNVVGCFLMGLLAGYLISRPGLAHHWRLFLTTGILGGFTTFSAFSLDTALLVERHAYAATAIYVTACVAGSIAALFLGLAVFRSSGQMQ